MDYKETIKERLKILPPRLRAFMLDEKWREDARKISKPFSFSEEEYASFENEIFLVLLCFEPKTDFIENIKRELEIDDNMATQTADGVNRDIFSKISGEMDQMWQTIERGEPGEDLASSGVGESFEQIILNQAKAMQPAVPPENLPTSPEPQKEIRDYKGQDPYREPVE